MLSNFLLTFFGLKNMSYCAPLITFLITFSVMASSRTTLVCPIETPNVCAKEYLKIYLLFDLDNLPPVVQELSPFIEKIEHFSEEVDDETYAYMTSRIIYGPGIRGVPIDPLGCGGSVERNRYTLRRNRIDISGLCRLPLPSIGSGGIRANLSLIESGRVTITASGFKEISMIVGICKQ